MSNVYRFSVRDDTYFRGSDAGAESRFAVATVTITGDPGDYVVSEGASLSSLTAFHLADGGISGTFEVKAGENTMDIIIVDGSATIVMPANQTYEMQFDNLNGDVAAGDNSNTLIVSGDCSFTVKPHTI